MAAGYGCANEECQRPVNWLITHLNPPLTLSTCDEDSPVFLIPILAAELGVDADKLYDAIRRHVDKEAKAVAKGKAEADEARAAAREQHGDLCPECGIAWDQPSPECPHEIRNLHPLPEGVA